MRKRKPQSKIVTSVRNVQCEYCNKIHNVMDGGWVYNGNQVLLCHDGVKDDCCFSKYRKRKEVG